MNDIASRADILHVHGIWEEHCNYSCAAARRAGRPHIVSAHGMLEDWGLRQKAWKKLPYLALFERRNLTSAACLRALTLHEVEDYRRAGIQTPAVVVPNGVTIPAGVTADIFRQIFPNLRSSRIVLFLGRLHTKKGVDLLCRAWGLMAGRFPDTVLLIAGPDSDGTEASMRSLVAGSGIADRVVFAGMIAGPLKWSALAASDVFVLPSHSEGFSVATLEALGIGLPVIITRQCWFPEVSRTGCGWIVEPEVRQLVDALTEALCISSADRAIRQARARELVDRNYTWAAVGKKTLDVYDWVLTGTRPTSLEVFQ